MTRGRRAGGLASALVAGVVPAVHLNARVYGLLAGNPNELTHLLNTFLSLHTLSAFSSIRAGCPVFLNSSILAFEAVGLKPRRQSNED